MNAPVLTRVIEGLVEFYDRPFVKPLQISSGKITEITEARVTVRVEVGGRMAAGMGSIYLSDLWAWPDPAFSHAERDARLRDLCSRIAFCLPELCGSELEHPLELGLRLHESVCGDGPDEDLPVLARAMCLSPFDAAVHDAAGSALGVSAFRFYDDDCAIPLADDLLAGGACRAIRSILRRPRRESDSWLIVSRGDSLEKDVSPWVRQRGYRCFKVKILGQSNEDDVRRTAEVYRAVRAMGARTPRLTVDSNEANPGSESVLDYLQRLQRDAPDAFEALEYLEQPTARDIRANPNDWTDVTRLKPVMLDEGLTSFDILPEARRQGWSGLALKTCKGHSFALVAAAWARRYGMMLSLQDLTNPGHSAIHAALFAAHIETVNGVELNSPQYTPDANAQWLPRLSGLFRPTNGVHRLPVGSPVGLGGTL